MSKLWSAATHFHRLAPKKKAARPARGKTQDSSVTAPDGVVGYYAPTWGMASVGQDDANVGVAFSGWNDITTALSESQGLELKGTQYLSLGGSSEQGTFTPETVRQMGEECADVKDAGYEGVCFDVEVRRRVPMHMRASTMASSVLPPLHSPVDTAERQAGEGTLIARPPALEIPFVIHGKNAPQQNQTVWVWR